MSRIENVRGVLDDAAVTAPEGGSVVGTICAATRTLLGADQVALSIHTDAGPVVADGSDVIAAMLDMAQTIAGDGPLLTGLLGDLPLIVGDPDEAAARWPTLTDTLASSPNTVRSMVVLPLRIGSARLGALSAYRGATGDLDTEQYADAVVLAGLATEMILSERSGAGPEPSAEPSSMGSPIVQQAVGMLAERHGVSVLDAQVRLRATAFGRGEPIDELAGRIVRREDMGEEPQ